MAKILEKIIVDGVEYPFKDTTYESKSASAGGTDLSLVTTGEKDTWNNKLSSSAIDDTAFGSDWNGDTTHAPSKNAIYDVLGDVETLLANL